MQSELIEILTEAEKTFLGYAEAGGHSDHAYGFDNAIHRMMQGRAFSRTRTDWLRLADNCKRLRGQLESDKQAAA